MGCKQGKVHAITPDHIKQSDDIQFPVSTQIITTTNASQIVTTENDIIQQTPPEQSNDAAKETEYVQVKVIAPDIDLTPVDDEAFSSALCQQRQAAIDNISYRRAIDQWQPKSLEQLIDSIKVLSKNQNEIDQAWIIFYWISKNIRYDTQAYFNNNIGSQVSTNVFFSRKAVCDGYANLYADLCTRIGLTCHKVSGYAKGYSFDARQKGFQKTNHAWNIISFKNGYSYFIESTWGSGHLDGSTKQYKANLVPHYFLCRPEYMIYGHLPEDPQWQLLKKPLTMEQYLMLPRTYGQFFELNLKIVSPIYTHKVALETGKSYGEVLIAAPTSDIKLSGSLRDESETTIEGGDFVYFDRDENLWRCRFAPQKAGNHTILIFACKKADTTTSVSSCTVEFTFDIDQRPTIPISYPYIWSHFFDYHLEIIKPVNTRYIDWPSDKNSPYCEILVRSHDDLYVSGKITNSITGKTVENGSLVNFNSLESLWQCLFVPSNSHASYKLTLFAQHFNEKESHCAVQFDLKQSHQSTHQNYISLPITYSQFHEARCHLFEPLSGVLKRESKVLFRCRIPGAHEVSITIDGQWLESDSTFSMDENYLFQCEFQVGQKEVTVWVKFDKKQSSFKGLLRYSVQQ
ncbi:unnamed protein product [Rotaria magnacalcarata]|uniref:Transglutaminase-like domain-containing protein n=1 Tax=Rotaria magnacalcarata TaxID=392030 RepID=A0A816X1H0_9BILA|nr:unnamed protein product [Rotaria magnacalcarata]CAF3836253.1 unnamed protein product [Rotaria magnacalcarata]